MNESSPRRAGNELRQRPSRGEAACEAIEADRGSGPAPFSRRPAGSPLELRMRSTCCRRRQSRTIPAPLVRVDDHKGTRLSLGRSLSPTTKRIDLGRSVCEVLSGVLLSGCGPVLNQIPTSTRLTSGTATAPAPTPEHPDRPASPRTDPPRAQRSPYRRCSCPSPSPKGRWSTCGATVPCSRGAGW